MPWAVFYPTAAHALRCAMPDAELVFVGDDDYAYARLVEALWGESFILVEHDIVVGPDTLRELIDCPEPWCGFPYLEEPASNPVTGLGCTKLDARLMDVPPWDMTPTWGNVDASLIGRIRDERGNVEHRHGPALDHLNPRVRP